MPILVPFLVRRSVRATTVPASRPAAAHRPFTTRENSAQVWTRIRCSTAAYSSSGWAER